MRIKAVRVKVLRMPDDVLLMEPNVTQYAINALQRIYRHNDWTKQFRSPVQPQACIRLLRDFRTAQNIGVQFSRGLLPGTDATL